MRGGERVLEQLLDYAPQAPIFTLFHFEGSVSAKIEAHPVVASYLQEVPSSEKHYRRYLPLFPSAIEAFDLGGYDLIVSSSHCVAKGAITRPDAYHLCYCHTPMRYIWDQEQAYFPQRSGPVAWVRRQLLSELRTWDVASASRVDLYVANSSFVAWRIQEYYGRSAEVVHPPVDVAYFTPDASERGNFCLAVSALSPYKRLDLAIEACDRAAVELRIVGAGPQRAELEQKAAGTRTRFLGRVEANELRQLYRTAGCFLQSGTEDFGIATVEALASGLPVVAVGVGGVLDIVENGLHGVLTDPGANPAELAEAIDKAKRIRFNEDVLRGKSEQFSATRFRESMQSLLEEHPTDLTRIGS